MAGICIFAENREHTLELLSAAQYLANNFDTKIVTFTLNKELVEEYINHGSDEILFLPPLAQEDQPIEAYVPVIVEAARQKEPDVFFVGETPRGKEIAARVAASLNTGLCNGCIGFNFNEEYLLMDRMIFGGAAVQTVVCTTRPQMATIPSQTFEQAPIVEGKQGKVTELPTPQLSTVKITNKIPKTQESVDLTEARIIVSVGRGVEKEEDINLASELAQVLGGEVGCTRPIAEELHWLPEERYIGISGKKVKPDLYIGLGVSGQIQHITGLRDSKIIFGINSDENAPIFKATDYGIIGNLYEVVPKLIEELKALKK